MPEKRQENLTNSKDISTLLEKNFEMMQNIQKQNEKILRNFFWMKVAGILRVLIILIPLILAVIFLPPLFRELADKYGEVLPYFTNQDFEELIKVLENYR